MQKARGIREVLARAPRRRAVDRLEHRTVVADIRRSSEADRACDLRGNVRENVAVEIGMTITSNASGVSAIFAAPMSTIQCSCSRSGYSCDISSKST